MEILIFVLVMLCIILATMCDTPSSISGYTTVETSPADTKLDTISNKTLLIFHAPWCGHCRRSMPDFLEASKRSNGKIVLINTDDPENKDLVSKYGVRSFPTIISSSGQKHTGPRDVDTLVELAENL